MEIIVTQRDAAYTPLEDLLRRRLELGAGAGPLLIGIGGGTAAGKSTLARALAAQLAPLRAEVIGQDRFFKPKAELPAYPSTSRPQPWPDYNRPDSFRVEELVACCRALAGVDVAILEGILVLHYPELRQLMALRLYVEADADERLARRLRRNVRAGMALDDVVDYYLESVRFQHERYNAPTRQHADIVVPGGATAEQARAAMTRAICAAVRRVLGEGRRPPARPSPPAAGNGA